MTDCAASHAAVNGGEASASWANVNTPFPCRRTSPLIGKGQVPLFVCPAIRLCLLASLSCYIPLLWPCRTFFNAHISSSCHERIESKNRFVCPFIADTFLLSVSHGIAAFCHSMPCRGYFAAKLMWRVLSLQTVLGGNLPWRFTPSVFLPSGLSKSHSAPFLDAEKYPAAGHRRKAESRERTKSVCQI